MDGGKVCLRKEEGEGSHCLDYKAVRLHGSYYAAFFLDNQALINYVNSQPRSEQLICLRDGHDGIRLKISGLLWLMKNVNQMRSLRCTLTAQYPFDAQQRKTGMLQVRLLPNFIG